MVYCAAFDCSNYSRKTTGISYHCFPKEPSLREQWLAKISRAHLIISNSTRLCSEPSFHTWLLRAWPPGRTPWFEKASISESRCCAIDILSSTRSEKASLIVREPCPWKSKTRGKSSKCNRKRALKNQNKLFYYHTNYQDHFTSQEFIPVVLIHTCILTLKSDFTDVAILMYKYNIHTQQLIYTHSFWTTGPTLKWLSQRMSDS